MKIGMADMCKELQNWQNVEVIFTQEELDRFVDEGKLDRIKLDNKIYYVKKGSSRFIKGVKRGQR